MGCWFHYSKNLIQHLIKRNIYLKKYKKINSKIIYLLKYFPYLDFEIKNKFFQSFKILFIQFSNLFDIEHSDKIKYVSYLNFFEKYWLKYNQCIKYKDIKSIDFNWEKTNNPCETFHKILNSRIIIKNPRISFLTDHIFDFIKSKHHEFCQNILKPKTKKEKISNFNFILSILKEKVSNFLIDKDLLSLMNSLDNLEDDKVKILYFEDCS